MKRLLLLLPLAGCAQILGLDETQGPGEGPDAGLPACEEELSCGTGEICGRIYDFASGASLAAAGDPVLCTDADTTSPCNLHVAVKTYPDLGGVALDRNIAQDSCGRFIIDDAPLGAEILSVQITGASYRESATLVTGNDVAHGDNVEVRAGAIRTSYFTDIGLGTPNPMPWLITTYGPAGTPQMANVIRRNATTIPAGTEIYYFSDQDRFMHMTPNGALASTGPNGTGLLLTANGELSTGCDRTLITAASFPSIVVIYGMYCDI